MTNIIAAPATAISVLPWTLTEDRSQWTATLPDGRTAVIERLGDQESFLPRVGDAVGPVCAGVLAAAQWVDQYTSCPAWCAGGEPGHPCTGMHELDDDTDILIARTPDGAVTAEILGDPSATAAEGSVTLSAAALAHLADVLAML
jgi:hypothetical protein